MERDLEMELRRLAREMRQAQRRPGAEAGREPGAAADMREAEASVDVALGRLMDARKETLRKSGKLKNGNDDVPYFMVLPGFAALLKECRDVRRIVERGNASEGMKALLARLQNLLDADLARDGCADETTGEEQ